MRNHYLSWRTILKVHVSGLIFIKNCNCNGLQSKKAKHHPLASLIEAQVDGDCRIEFGTSKGDNSLTLWENHSGGLLGSPKALICLLTETLKTNKLLFTVKCKFIQISSNDMVIKQWLSEVHWLNFTTITFQIYKQSLNSHPFSKLVENKFLSYSYL